MEREREKGGGGGSMKTNGKRSGNEKLSLNKKCGRCPPPLKDNRDQHTHHN
jgi:hypothetical protein